MSLVKISIIFFVLIFVLLLTVFSVQNKILYMPDLPDRPKTKILTAKNFGISSESAIYETRFITTSDGVSLHIIIFSNNDKTKISRKKKTVLFFQGNAGNVSHRIPFFSKLVSECNVNVVAVSYRGYGLSSGSPSEYGLKIDARTIYDYITADNIEYIDNENIIIFGTSLGCVVSIDLASSLALSNEDKNIVGVILENPFTSIDDMIDKIVGKQLGFLKFMSINRWRNIDLIQYLTKKVLFMVSMKDEVVPMHHSNTLFDRCISSEKKMFSMPNAHHNDCNSQPNYYKEIRSFIR